MVTCELSRVCWVKQGQHIRQHMQFTRGRKRPKAPFAKGCGKTVQVTIVAAERGQHRDQKQHIHTPRPSTHPLPSLPPLPLPLPQPPSPSHPKPCPPLCRAVHTPRPPTPLPMPPALAPALRLMPHVLPQQRRAGGHGAVGPQPLGGNGPRHPHQDAPEHPCGAAPQ